MKRPGRREGIKQPASERRKKSVEERGQSGLRLRGEEKVEFYRKCGEGGRTEERWS